MIGGEIVMGINGIEKLHPEPRPSEAQLRLQVNEEIPYVVGKGQATIQKRHTRLRALMKEYGYDDKTPGLNTKVIY